MARILKHLRINEVSAVLRGAGEGCEIKISKSDDRRRGYYGYEHMFKASVDEDELPVDTAENNYDDGAGERRNEDRYQDRKGRQQEGDIIATSVMPPRLQQMVDAIRAHAPKLSDGEIVHFLLHTARGRAVAEHLSNITKRKDRPTMSRQEIVKRYGLATIAKGMLKDNDPYGFSEHEFTEFMVAQAKRKGVSFEKYFTAPENLDVRRAHQLTKGTLVEVQPISVDVGFTDNGSDWQKAYAQLQEMAEELRQSAPYLTVAQAFERVFTDQANAELAARAHRRPNAAHA
jgi:hypothetical protein